MATTIERPQSAQVVAHATEYPADRDGQGSGHDRHKQSDSAERHQIAPEDRDENPAVLIDAHHVENHTLDGVTAYRAAALSLLEPGIPHGPVHPLPGPIDRVPPENIRTAYEDHEDENSPHEVNVAT